MASQCEDLFEDLYASRLLKKKIKEEKVLVVGAGGIGCEVVKNLVMCGFKNIAIVDLDTIEVSNLNRQLLFRVSDVGKSKSEVAAQAAKDINPSILVKPYYCSITEPEFDIQLIKRFAIVINALDNMEARRHMNRLCLISDIPLIETGTAGYEGQAELIKKDLTQCYDCAPKPVPKTYPSCTIRNKPRELIHCIIWAKHFYNQLFGVEDPESDVSPDILDDETNYNNDNDKNKEKPDILKTISTRAWAKSCNYDPKQIFNKVFSDDIKYLLKLEPLWEERKPPNPLHWEHFVNEDGSNIHDVENITYNGHWDVAISHNVFINTLKELTKQYKEKKEPYGKCLIWDKDNDTDMDFVAACSNLRAFIFGIPQDTRFNIKSMAANIIPAIATTNAIIAGLAVMQAFRVLSGRAEDCFSVYLRQKLNHRDYLVVSEQKFLKPNDACTTCREMPSIMHIDLYETTVEELKAILKKEFKISAPDVIIEKTKALVISSEEGETDDNGDKYLEEIGIVNGSILSIDDFESKSPPQSVMMIHSPYPMFIPDNNPLKPEKYILDPNPSLQHKLAEPDDKEDILTTPDMQVEDNADQPSTQDPDSSVSKEQGTKRKQDSKSPSPDDSNGNKSKRPRGGSPPDVLDIEAGAAQPKVLMESPEKSAYSSKDNIAKGEKRRRE